MAELDRREIICARLRQIAADTPGVAKAFRNADAVSGKTGVAVVIWDGDETALEDEKNRPIGAPRRIVMSPMIDVVVEAPADEVGGKLNGLRRALIKAVTGDATLSDMVGTSGHLRYQGCTTELARGRTMTGTLGLNFEFEYTLYQGEL